MFKICSKCKQEKSITEFCKNKNSKDKLNLWCKSCAKASTSKWISDNPEKSKASSRNWKRNNPIKLKEYETNRYWNNRESEKQRIAKYRYDNPNNVKLTQKKYRDNNYTKILAKNSSRRAGKNSATPKWLTHIQKAQIQEMYDLALARSMQTNIKYHVDHIHPLKGKKFNGLHVPWNLQIIQEFENIIKGNRPPKSELSLFW